MNPTLQSHAQDSDDHKHMSTYSWVWHPEKVMVVWVVLQCVSKKHPQHF